MCLLAVAGLAFQPAAASTTYFGAAAVPYVVIDDPGGGVAARLREVHTLAATGRQVQIRGRYCYSSCTMLLGLPDACISPSTVFGFHGPSRNGRPLDRQTFERASRIIAATYPAPLRSWYMTEARHRLTGLHRLRGQDLLAMDLGLSAC